MNTQDTAMTSIGKMQNIQNLLSKIVGPEFVLTSLEEREKHSKVTLPYKKVCSVVVYPASVEEVQKIILLANEFNFKIWPFSRGNNWGYGTKNSLEEDSIIIILERMNKIIEVNEELAYVVVEPGVSQKQLNDYLKEKKLKLWMDCTDSTPNGSVLGNAVERGYGYTPYGDHFGHLCGMEVILPTGEIIKTGGEHAKAKTWNTHKWGSGPYLEGLFSQSNMGVVVKAGIWLMPEPEHFVLFNFETYDDTQLPKIIDSLREMSLKKIIQCHTHMVNDFQMLSVLSRYPYELRKGKKYLSDDTLSELKTKLKIPSWSMIGGVYGQKAVVEINCALIKKELSKYGDILFLDDKKMSFSKKFIKISQKNKNIEDITLLGKIIKPLISTKPMKAIHLLPEVFDILKGIPNESIISSSYFKSSKLPPASGCNPAEDGCGLMWLAPTISAKGSEAQRILDVVKPIYREYGFEFSGCFTLMNSRTFFVLMGIFFNQEDSDERERALYLYKALESKTKKEGFIQYRLGNAAMEQFMVEFPEAGKFLNKIKTIVDPKNILAPSKYINNKLK